MVADTIIEHIEVNDKKYKLQHPGNRAVLRLQSEAVNARTGAANLEPMMDYCFEHVVVPDGHGFQPSLDNLHPREFEQWLGILPGFLRGESMEQREASQKGAGQGGGESPE